MSSNLLIETLTFSLPKLTSRISERNSDHLIPMLCSMLIVRLPSSELYLYGKPQNLIQSRKHSRNVSRVNLFLFMYTRSGRSRSPTSFANFARSSVLSLPSLWSTFLKEASFQRLLRRYRSQSNFRLFGSWGRCLWGVDLLLPAWDGGWRWRAFCRCIPRSVPCLVGTLPYYV